MTELRIGVIGLGVISRFYLEALRHVPGLSLTSVCDVRPDRLTPFLGSVECWSDHRGLLASGMVDAVVVTVPNDQHNTVCRDALEAGMSVCVEKPLAIRREDGVALVDLALARERVLFTSFHRRYNEHVLALRGRMPGGVPIESMVVRYLERIEDHVGDDGWYLDPDRCGGGCVADNGPNAFDLVRTFLGPVSLDHADIDRDERGVDRRARIALTAGSGARAVVELDWSYPGERKDIEIQLADGSIRRADLLAGFPGFKQSLWHEYVGVLREFERSVRQGDCDTAGLAALALVDATYRARRVDLVVGEGLS